MDLVRARRALEVAFVIALPAMSLPLDFLDFLPVMALAAAVPALRVTLVIAAVAAAAMTASPRDFFVDFFFAAAFSAGSFAA